MTIEVILERIAQALEHIASNTGAAGPDTAMKADDKPKRTRKVAVDPTPAPAAAEAPTAPAPVDAPATPAASPTPAVSVSNATVKQVANAVEALAIARGRDAAIGVLASFGVERVSFLKADQLAPALAAITAATAAPAPVGVAVTASLV
jgi:pyruvate dehydrogenase E2 component (dihydrolipoamide acetyltransferase)